MASYTIGNRNYISLEALVAQRKEQGPSKPEVAGSSPAESPRPSAWICTSRSEAFVTQDEDAVRAFMDRGNGWTVVPLFTRSTVKSWREALVACPLEELEAEYVRRSQHAPSSFSSNK